MRLMKSLAKFNYVLAELQCIKPTFACITETWLTNNMPFTCYNIDSYTAFFNNKNDKTGGSAAIYVDNAVECRQQPTDNMSTDSFNVCAVTIFTICDICFYFSDPNVVILKVSYLSSNKLQHVRKKLTAVYI